MTQDPMHDDSSHYEISLTAAQAFTAFVLILLSLAASFAFGIIIGRGRSEVGAKVQSGPTILEEKALGNEVTDIEPPEQRVASPSGSAGSETSPAATIPPESKSTARAGSPGPVPPSPVVVEASTEPVPHVAQLLSTQEAASAESLAARLIDDGFTTAYVERVRGENGMIYRVRVEYPSEAAARNATTRLGPYAPGEIWVSRK